MEEQNTGLQYNDSDIAKLSGSEAEQPTPSEDGMFEDLFSWDGQPVEEQAPAEEAPAEEENILEDFDAPEEAPAEEWAIEWEWETWDSEGINVDDVNTEWLSPEVLEILNSISVSDDATVEAQDGLEQAINSWDQNQLQKAYDDLVTASAEKDRQIEQLIKQVANERAQSDRLLDENMLATTQNREMQRISDYLSENPLVRDIIVYSMSGNDAKAADLTKQLYEQTNWVSVDNMLSDKKRAEKLGMGEWLYGTDAESPEWNNLWGMLEDW